MGLLDGKVAIVTGGARGIGFAHARALAKEGAAVVVNDLGGGFRGEGSAAGPAEEAAAAIRAAGGRAVADTTDISDWDAVAGIVEKAVKEFGRLDIIVNNAGIAAGGPTAEITRQDWDRTIGVNLTGTAALCHWAGAHWRDKGPEAGRRIINTASSVGLTIPPGAFAYAASKAGVAALTICCALDLAPLGVRANGLAPVGRTRISETMAPDMMKKPESGFDIMDPDNVAAVVVYLASEHCDFTGRVIGSIGDQLDVFDGWTVSFHDTNGQKRWTIDALKAALAEVPRQQRGNAQYGREHATPSDAALEALAAVEKAKAPA